MVIWLAGKVVVGLVGAAVGVALAAATPPTAASSSAVTTTSAAATLEASPAPPTGGLEAVITTTGAHAYVRSDELNEASGGAVANPAEAKQWMNHLDDLRALGITEIYIPAYLEDSKTVVGEFAISIGSPDAASGISAAELCEVFADDPAVLEELLAGRSCPDSP